MKKIKKIIWLLCAFSLALFVSTPKIAYALPRTAQNKNLISKVYNSSEGKITVTLNVPANKTVKLQIYPNRNIGGRQYGTMAENIEVNVTNNTSSERVITRTYDVQYYSEYIVHAFWSGSNYPGSGGIWDEHKVVSKCNSIYYTNKFTWTDDAIKKYKRGESIKIFAMLGIDIIVGLADPTKIGLVGMSIATVGAIYDSATIDIASEETIDETPIKGYSYRTKFVGKSSGIEEYLLCYNTAGTLVKSTYIGTIDYIDGQMIKVFK